MNALARTIILAGAASCVWAWSAAAQHIEVPIPRAEPALLAISSEHKDPAVAGLLSFIIPGGGSFYAGNNKHGAIHFGMNGIGWSLILAGASIPDDCARSCETPYATAAIAGLVAVPVNWVWSIFTAVDDAHRHNRAATTPTRVAGGGLTFSARVTVLGIERPGTARRIGAQAISWRF